MKTVTADTVAQLTTEAYSYERYGHKNWVASIKVFEEMGFEVLEIVAILQSRYMRSALDEMNDVFSVARFRKQAYEYLTPKFVAQIVGASGFHVVKEN